MDRGRDRGGTTKMTSNGVIRNENGPSNLYDISCKVSSTGSELLASKVGQPYTPPSDRLIKDTRQNTDTAQDQREPLVSSHIFHQSFLCRLAVFFVLCRTCPKRDREHFNYTPKQSNVSVPSQLCSSTVPTSWK